MENVVLVIHLFLALAIIGLVLLQRSEGGGLGIGGGGGGGLGGLATPQGASGALVKATAFCAVAFFCTSLLLGILAAQSSNHESILEALEEEKPAIETPVEVPAGIPAVEAPIENAPAAPVVPLVE